MNKLIHILLLLFALNSFSQESFINGLSLDNGGKIVKSPESYQYNPKRHENVMPYTPESLIDERETSIWCSGENSKFPLQFVFELSDMFQVKSLYFDNRCDEQYAGVGAQRIKVEFSTEGPENGFEEVLDIKLHEHESNSIKFDDQQAKWIRLTIRSNHGNKNFVELKNFQVWGSYAYEQPETRNIAGTWSSNWGWVSIHQTEDNNYYGCYEFQEGKIVTGQLKNGRRFEFDWKEDGFNSEGWAKLTVNNELDHILGIWGKNENEERYGIWELKKASSDPKDCSFKPKKDSVIVKTVIDVTLDLKIKNADDKSLLKGAEITLTDIKSSKSYEFKTDDFGKINSTIPLSDYNINIKKEGFKGINERFSYIKVNNIDNSMTLKSQYSIEPFKIGDSFKLENIQFERGKYTLLEKSHIELDTLVILLNNHPNMKIQIEGHTDNQGSSKLNKVLSEQRVESVKEYLVTKGIKQNRIHGIGYGGTKPIADNRDPKKRKLNRRVEFIITDL